MMPHHPLACSLIRVSVWTVACAASLGVSVPASGQQAIHGHVWENESGVPVLAAVVSLTAEGESENLKRHTTDSTGRYRFAVPPGRYTLQVRRLGFSPQYTLVYDVRRMEDRVVNFRLVKLAITLDTVATRGRSVRRSFMLDGFEQRRASTSGTFFDRKQLEERGSPPLPIVLREVPGLRIYTGYGRTSVSSARGNVSMFRQAQCQPLIVLDGVSLNRADDPPETTHSILSMIDGRDVEAIEVYKSRSQLPAEYSGSHATCGAIIVWSRQPGLEHQRRASPK